MTERGRTRPPTPEQDLAIRTQAPHVLVSASAGTGKTHTLVERLLFFLADGVPLERMLVITFTRKAAGELKERLYAAFDADPRLRPLRLALPQAYVTTIDGFCSRLLREHALDARIDPGFGVLADPDDRLVIAEILDAIFHHAYLGRPPDQPAEGAWAGVPERGSAGHREFLRLVELCRMRAGREVLKQELEHLLSLARVRPDPERFLDRLAAGLRAPQPPYQRPFALGLLAHWRAATRAYDRLLEIGRAEFDPGKFARHEALARVLRAAPLPWGTDGPAPDDLPGALAALHAHLSAAGVLTGKRTWELQWPVLPGGTKPRLGALNDLAKALLGHGSAAASAPLGWLPDDPGEIATQYAATRPTLETLLDLLRLLMDRYAAHKRERGLLDFADLEQETVRLLRAAPPGLLERFELVFVDEFQDVNSLQAEIVDRLQPRRGRFLVGDVKQCIYQFRLADPSIFRERFRAAPVRRPGDAAHAPHPAVLTVPDERVRLFLSSNFRSRPPVLAAVNRIFARLFWPEMIGGPYDEQALHLPAGVESAQPADAGGAPVEIHLFEKPPVVRGATLPPALEMEARFVAERIRDLQAHGPRVPAEDGGWRAIRFADIAVLLRSPGPTGAAFARVLRAEGVPVAFGGLDFFEREEVRDFLNLLAVLDNAHDDVALAAVLRSPAVGFDDSDLLRLRLAWPAALALMAALRATASGRADDWSGPPGHAAALADPPGLDLAQRARRFVAELDRWRALAQNSDLPAAVAAVLDASGLLDAVAAQPGGTGRVGHLQQLLALVQTYARERDHGLPGLVRHLASLRMTGPGPETLPAEQAAEDAVRMLSLHKAKGLEFPVVFLALQGRAFNLQDTRHKVLTGPDWIGADIFEPETYALTPTIAHRTLAAERATAIREEELRILYVALTRAREKLIVTGTLGRDWDDAVAGAAALADDELRRHAALRARAPLVWIVDALSDEGWLDRLTAPETSAAVEPWLVLHRHGCACRLAPCAEAAPAAAGGSADGPQATAGEHSPAAEGPGATEALARLRAELPDLAVRIARRYPEESARGWRGKYWVTEIKRLIDADVHADEIDEGVAAGPSFLDAPARPGAASAREESSRGERARAEGTWLHAVLEAVDPARATAADVLAAAESLAAAGRVPAAWVAAGNLEPVTDFFSTPLGGRMGAAGPRLEREAAFSLRLAAERLAAIWPRAGELAPAEWLLIQGQIDALWPQPDGGWVLVDFKSDRVASEREIAARAERYRAQILLYREAVRALWGAATVECWLHFLRPRRSVRVD